MSTIAVRSARLKNGLTLPYAESGYPGGAPVVFLHGLGESWRVFERLLSRLPVGLHGFAPTQRGHRDTAGDPQGFRPEDYAADVVDFLDAVELPRVILVSGGSGGVAARIVAAAYPDRVAGLLLLGSPATLADKPQAPQLVRTAEELTDPVGEDAARRLLFCGAGADVAPPDLRDELTDDARQLAAEVWRESVRGLLEADLLGTLSGILVPTRAVCGDQDQAVPESDQRTIADTVFGGELTVHPGAGHLPHWEIPDQVTKELSAFAARTAGIPAG